MHNKDDSRVHFFCPSTLTYLQAPFPLPVRARLNPCAAHRYQEKATVISERVLGRDHWETINNYMHLGQYYFVFRQTDKALAVLRLLRRFGAASALYPFAMSMSCGTSTISQLASSKDVPPGEVEFKVVGGGGGGGAGSLRPLLLLAGSACCSAAPVALPAAA